MTRDEAHAILGTHADLDARDIKRAYARLARAHPPDRDPERFQQVRAAFDLLSSAAEEAPNPHPVRAPADSRPRPEAQPLESPPTVFLPATASRDELLERLGRQSMLDHTMAAAELLRRGALHEVMRSLVERHAREAPLPNFTQGRFAAFALQVLADGDYELAAKLIAIAEAQSTPIPDALATLIRARLDLDVRVLLARALRDEAPEPARTELFRLVQRDPARMETNRSSITQHQKLALGLVKEFGAWMRANVAVSLLAELCHRPVEMTFRQAETAATVLWLAFVAACVSTCGIAAMLGYGRASLAAPLLVVSAGAFAVAAATVTARARTAIALLGGSAAALVATLLLGTWLGPTPVLSDPTPDPTTWLEANTTATQRVDSDLPLVESLALRTTPDARPAASVIGLCANLGKRDHFEDCGAVTQRYLDAIAGHCPVPPLRGSLDAPWMVFSSQVEQLDRELTALCATKAGP